MLDEIDSEQLTEWMAYYSIDPFGDYRDDLRAGLIASVIANTARNPEKKSEPFTITDFLLFKDPEPEEDESDENEPERFEQSWEDMLTTVTLWNTLLGGEDLRNKEN